MNQNGKRRSHFVCVSKLILISMWLIAALVSLFVYGPSAPYLWYLLPIGHYLKSALEALS